ncbi:MAG: SGNH hydrolase domain-containing protein [Solirubrobacteraceae bacterium]|nr:SGNH hydrolase domain-containing protein [Solirubrobacteraceae bacterium]
MLRRVMPFVLALASLGLVVPAHAAPLRLTPPTHADPIDAAGGPLDLRSVSFGQVDTQLQLSIETGADWKPRTLGPPESGRSLCLRVDGPGAKGLVCVDTEAGRPVLRYRSDSDPPAADAGDWRTLIAAVGRPDDAMLLASFPPSELGLEEGAFSWSVESRWFASPAAGTGAGGPTAAAAPDAAGNADATPATDADCPVATPCADRIPDGGAFGARSAVLVQPRCFGAASRDPQRPCSNPALRTLVVPTPSDAVITPNAPCEPTDEPGLAHPCTFGRPTAPGREHVLLVGDSHASHWRGALEVVAQTDGWSGTSITRSGCPFTVRPNAQDDRRDKACARWFAAARRWLVAHPEVETIYTSSHVLADTPERRKDYQRTWASLPKSVKRIYVIRDTPKVDYAQAPCVSRRLRYGLPAGLACSQPRKTNLPPDPNAAAARTSGQSRVRPIDLTRFFCGQERCLAVVGSVLVRKDNEHMTNDFSTTLGPYLRRAAHGG